MVHRFWNTSSLTKKTLHSSIHSIIREITNIYIHLCLYNIQKNYPVNFKNITEVCGQVIIGLQAFVVHNTLKNRKPSDYQDGKTVLPKGCLMEEDYFFPTLVFRLANLLGTGMLQKENQSTI